MCDLNSFIAGNFWLAFAILVVVFLLGGLAVLAILGFGEDTKTKWIVTTSNFKLILKLILTVILTAIMTILEFIAFKPITDKYPKSPSVIAAFIVVTIAIGIWRFIVYQSRIKKSLKVIKNGQQSDLDY